MCKLTIPITMICLTLATCGVPNLAKADDLFSQDGLDSVFAPQQPMQGNPQQPALQQPALPQQPSMPQQQGPARAVEKAQLGDFLRAAGFQPTAVNDQIQGVEIQKDNWKFPVIFMISENKESLWIGVILITVESNKISQPTLLGFLEAQNKYGPAHFSYDSQSKRIFLNLALKNDNLMPADVSKAVNSLLQISVETAKLWSNPQGNGEGPQSLPGQPSLPIQPPTQPAPPTQQPALPYWQTPSQPQQPVQPQQQVQPQPSVPTQGSIVGKWGASPRSGLVFVIQFESNGTFMLFHKNLQGQESKSVGRYSMADGNLTMAAEDGTTLTGKFVWNDAQSFTFTPTTSGDNLTFVRV